MDSANLKRVRTDLVITFLMEYFIFSYVWSLYDFMTCNWEADIRCSMWYVYIIKFAYTDSGFSTWQIVDVSEDILRVKQEIDVELHGEDQSWVRNDSAVSPLITLCLGLFLPSKFS